MDLHISSEVFTDGLFCDVFNNIVIKNLLIHLESSVVVGEDQCSSWREMHCCSFNELSVVSLYIEGASPVFAVGEGWRITEYQVEPVVGVPKIVQNIGSVEEVS